MMARAWVAVAAAAVALAPVAQDPRSALEALDLARTHYLAHRLAAADQAVTRAAALMTEERDLHAVDRPPADLPAGAPLPVGGVVLEPVRVKNAAPSPVKEALRLGLTGLVTMEFVVDKAGKVGQVRIVDSVAPLDDAARAIVQKWVYAPVTVDGAPVSVLAVGAVMFTGRTDWMPADDLAMARFYCEHRHYGAAEGLMKRAAAAMKEESRWFGPSTGTGPLVLFSEKALQPPGVEPPVPRRTRLPATGPVRGSSVFSMALSIDETGKVRAIRVVKSVLALDQAMVDAARAWDYRPATRDGKPIPVVIFYSQTMMGTGR